MTMPGSNQLTLRNPKIVYRLLSGPLMQTGKCVFTKVDDQLFGFVGGEQQIVV